MKIYKSIDTLPIANFEAINKTNNLNYLRKDVDFDDIQNDPPTEILFEAWANISEQLPFLNLENLQNECLLAALKLTFEFETNNRLKWQADMERQEIEKKIKEKEEVEIDSIDFVEIYGLIGEMYNTIIDPFTYKTKQFFYDYKKLKDRNEQARANSKKSGGVFGDSFDVE